MIRSRIAAAVAALAVTAAGCGVGPGESSPGEATLTVTRDFGSVEMVDASVSDPAESETVIRMLDREAEVQTRYGGGFVQAIDGVSGAIEGGRTSDWFFFVNGTESPRGSAEVQVRGGDRVWWDYRDWTDAMRAPAVVGSWPEPFLQASAPAAERHGVVVECHRAGPACATATAALEDAGVEVADGAGGAARMLVGPWSALRDDPAAAQLERGPATSGVFVEIARADGATTFAPLDPTGAVAAPPSAAAGLVAAVRDGEAPPTWVVTGGRPAAVEAAAALLSEPQLHNRYAVLATDGRAVALPAEAPG